MAEDDAERVQLAVSAAGWSDFFRMEEGAHYDREGTGLDVR